MSPLSAAEMAFVISLTNPQPFDIKFWLFSRRTVVKTHTGDIVRVCEPRAIYGMSSVLKRTEYFDNMLSNGFSESSSQVTACRPFPPTQASFIDDYDYDSDSDLEDDLRDDGSDMDRTESSQPEIPSPLLERVTQGECAEVEALSQQPSQPLTVGAPLMTHEAKATCLPCREVVIRDAAFETFRALVLYLHTGKVHFRSLKSGKYAEKKRSEIGSEEREGVPSCSPKSMYRLAEKLGLSTLETLSLDAIQMSLMPSNILTEILSEFTSLYPSVLQMEITYLCEHYDHPDVTSGWHKALERLCDGDFPYAAGVMSHLMKESLAPRPKTIQVYRPPTPDYVDCSYGDWFHALMSAQERVT